MQKSNSSSFIDSIQNRDCLIGVIGLGYVGLPLIDAFTNAGFRCLGFDVDQRKIDDLKAGKSYIKHIDSGKIGAWLEKDLFDATVDMARLDEPDALLICVPTPLEDARDPDLKYVVDTCEQIAEVIRAGQLVVLESTTYPTTTRDVMIPILEKKGLKAGEDFFVAYSPEREDPGNPDFSAAGIRRSLVQSMMRVWRLLASSTSRQWRAPFRLAIAKWPKPRRFSRTFIELSTSPW